MPPTRGSEGHLEQLQRISEIQARQLDFRRRTLGAAHADTLQTLASLSQSLIALGELGRARALQEEALRIRLESASGPRDPRATAAAWTLFHTLNRLGDVESMRALFHAHLAWLAQAQSAGLDDELVRIREWVLYLPEERSWVV